MQLHGDVLGDAGADQVADGAAAEVVGHAADQRPAHDLLDGAATDGRRPAAISLDADSIEVDLDRLVRFLNLRAEDGGATVCPLPQDSPMTFLKHWLLPTLAWTLMMFSTQTAVAQEFMAATKSDSTELQAYRLTIEDVHKWYAVMLATIRLARTHPELAKEDTADLSLAPLTVRARHIEEHPQGREVLRAGGLTGRRFIVIGLVLTGAGLAQMGVQSDLINPANVAFMNEHQAELQRLQVEMYAALPDSLRPPVSVMSLPAAGVRETAHLVVTGGPNAGTYDAQTTEGGCSYGLAGPGSWGNQLSSMDPDPRKFNSLQLIVPNASAAAAGSKQFVLTVAFGPPVNMSAHYDVDTRAREDRSSAEATGSGTVTIEDRGNTATVTFSAQTSAGVKLEGKIECRSVMRSG